MSHPALTSRLFAAIEAGKRAPEGPLLAELTRVAALSPAERAAIAADGAGLVRDIRSSAKPGLMEVFLAEYGLSTDEGIALMCLAEALLRVPDAETVDELIEDKIAPSDWGRHLGHSASPLVNGSTWALMLTGRVLEEGGQGIAGRLRGAVKRLGEPVIRAAVQRAMKEMGRQFVLGESIEAAMDRGRAREGQGYTHSFDMLGEAAMTHADAARYMDAYRRAIAAIAGRCNGNDPRRNPGISVKLSALFPRYEVAQEEAALAALVPSLGALARQAAAAGMGLSVDAEEADRLVLSLKVIEGVLSDPALEGWDGFGVVVQAYGRRALPVIDWLHALAERLDRRIAVRLVKGAYWDTEIKRAQVEGLEDFPVFTRKQATDVSYIACARRLLDRRDRIYPQFATHNAHTVAAVLRMAGGVEGYEFQRLHGMGERLHDIIVQRRKAACRIYAPVGAHRELLAYLVRRLLENGANSSFVNQIVDEGVAPETIAACPFAALGAMADAHPLIPTGPDLFGPSRRNSAGFDLTDAPTLARIDAARAAEIPSAAPILAAEAAPGKLRPVLSPIDGHLVAEVEEAGPEAAAAALAAARPWGAAPEERAAVLRAAADLYEAHYGPLFAALADEAGKTLMDAVAELREAVDFLRFYADGADASPPRGVFTCISPWNFPLAIFTGQVAAALATGNAVLAKPAPQTPLVAAMAVRLLHEAGVPRHALQLLPGGGELGAALTSDARVDGVAFTGSTETAKRIQAAMAEHLAPGAPLIAETGGLNAMIVDSTALPEQAVRDVVASAFQSAGQRCSALRCLYVQEDVAAPLTEMILGAMDALSVGDPWRLSTDVGPVIDQAAREGIEAHVAEAEAEGRLIRRLEVPAQGSFTAPALIRVGGIADIGREVFGPVLHIATFKAGEVDAVIDAVNATGYGLTFGLHSRIDARVQQVTDRVEAGNVYVNRNQVGAVVESQPFGGEGLSGTGPKAGGPNYLARFRRPEARVVSAGWDMAADAAAVQAALDAAAGQGRPVPAREMPGPTGEANRLSMVPRAPVLCLGPGRAAAEAQAEAVRGLGGAAAVAPGAVDPAVLGALGGLSGALWWGDAGAARGYAAALAARSGPILPLICAAPDTGHVMQERHLCVDTTASGGNAQLLAAAGAADMEEGGAEAA